MTRTALIRNVLFVGVVLPGIAVATGCAGQAEGKAERAAQGYYVSVYDEVLESAARSQPADAGSGSHVRVAEIPETAPPSRPTQAFDAGRGYAQNGFSLDARRPSPVRGSFPQSPKRRGFKMTFCP